MTSAEGGNGSILGETCFIFSHSASETWEEFVDKAAGLLLA